MKGLSQLISTVMVLIVMLIVGVVIALFLACLSIPGLGALPLCHIGGIGIKENFEIKHEINKADWILYSLLSTKVNNMEFEACIKFFDCVKDTEEEKCREIYGGSYSKEACEQFVKEVLEKTWDKRIRVYGNNFDIIAHEHSYTSKGVRTTWNIFIPKPKAYIPITLEVYS